MEEGRISTWLRSEGDEIAKGDVLFEIETDKAAVEVEAEHAGILHHIALGDGESAPVGDVLAWIYGPDEDVGPPPEVQPATRPGEPTDDRAAPSASATPKERAATGKPAAPETTPPAEPGSPSRKRLLATPAARAEAKAHGVPLQSLAGTGPSARIQKSDIQAAITSPPAPDAPAQAKDQPGALSVQSSGHGTATPMVMIHGFLADASGWEKLTRPLEAKRRIHRIELPCHGRSPMRQLASFADLARDLRKAFDDLGLERCHLIGHSLGAALALAIADTRPRTIGSLTLISPAGLGPQINGPAIEGMCRATRAESLGPWMKLLTADPDAIGWPYVQAAAAARRDPALRASQLALANALFPDGVQAFDMRPALDRITAPTRIIWGRDDKIIPWKHALHAPGHASLNLYHGVGHMPQYEIPEKLTPMFDALP